VKQVGNLPRHPRLGMDASRLVLATLAGVSSIVLQPVACTRSSGDSSAAPKVAATNEPTLFNALPQPDLPPRHGTNRAESNAVAPSHAPKEARELHFAWRPEGAKASEYLMTDPLDQHQILIMPGVERGAPNAVIALHGQPRRGQLPRDYEFPRVVADLAQKLVASREVAPFVLLIPRFRFEGRNWPAFALKTFLAKANEALASEGIELSSPLVLGHSGAAGCGGLGLNHAVSVEPRAVAFFDTCLGPGFSTSVNELTERGIPVLILHSVETAGYRPRQATEYVSSFDYGRVYRGIGLIPTNCPVHVPDAPLRPLGYHCAANLGKTTQAIVIDTGEGERAHNAVVPVGLRYFLMQYLGRP
jgi:hypothetical protein